MIGVSTDTDRAANLLRRGHFVFESGHHGDTWLDLDLLISDPRRARAEAERLAAILRHHPADAVVGPLDGGAFLAQWVAAALDLRFGYATREVVDGRPRYAIPPSIDLRGKRVVVVDDAINMGSATEATVSALTDAGAIPIAIASIFVCAPTGPTIGERLGLPQIWLTKITTKTWPAHECPMHATSATM
jgi:orotate phosphoribosyltransferase